MSHLDPFDLVAAKRPRLQLPWETGFVGMVLCRDPLGFKEPMLGNLGLNPKWSSNFLNSACVREQDVLAEVEKVSLTSEPSTKPRPLKTAGDNPAWTLVARSSELLCWEIKVVADRQVAMERWRVLVSDSPKHSRLGRQLIEAAAAENSHDMSARILADTFEMKATATMLKRAGSLLLLLRWLKALPSEQDLFLLPFSEQLVYEYLCMLKCSHAAASRGQALREAIAFSHGVIGADNALETMNSMRCQGSALSLFKEKALYKQMSPFTAVQVAAFESGIFELDDACDRILAGWICSNIHFRARHSDTYHCATEPVLDLDESNIGFMELGVEDTKTSNRRERRRRALPLIAHSHGVTGLPWASEYLKLRKQLGLDATKGPLMPAMLSSGVFSKARLRSQDATTWMLEILRKMKVHCEPGQRLGMHSGKITLLSWCAKAMLRLETRKLLGYHTSSKEEVALLYSRDALAGPMYELGTVIAHVREGRFSPDCTRSGRWNLQPQDDDFDADCSIGRMNGETTDVVDLNIAGVGPSISGESGNEGLNGSDGFVDAGEESGPSEGQFDFPPNPCLPPVCARCLVMLSSPRCNLQCDFCRVCGCTSCLQLTLRIGGLQCDDCWYGDGAADDPVVPEGLSDAESISSAGASSTDDDDSGLEDIAVDEAAEVLLEKSGQRKPAGVSDADLWQHLTLKTLHLERKPLDSGQPMMENRTACGRRLVLPFVKINRLPMLAFPRCGTCFGSHENDD